MIQVTFQKRNGDILQRIRKTHPSYRVGQLTSMGWKVLDIKYKYKSKWYSNIEYDNLIDRDFKRFQLRNNIKKDIKNIYKQLIYGGSLLLLIRIIKEML